MSRPLGTVPLLYRSLIFSHHLTRSRPCFRFIHNLTRQNGPVTFQPVRFRKPSIRTRIKRAAIEVGVLTLVVGTFFWYFDLLDDEEEHVQGEEGARELEGEGEEGDEVQIPETMPEDAIFIPFSLTRQLPQTFYKGSDPEWQSFIKFKRDRDREPKVRKELVSMVGSYFSGMKSMQKALGTPMKVKDSWIDALVPEGPPPEYERSGLEITDEYIAWTTRPVSAFQNARFKAAVFPLPVAKSFWASFNASLSLQIARIKQMLKLDAESEIARSPLPSGTKTLDQLQENDTKQNPQPSTRMDKLSDPKPVEEEAAAKAYPNQSLPLESSKILSLLPSLPQVYDENGPAIIAFKQTLARNWRPPQNFGERGTILMTGLVKIEGSRGICVVDIAASYHPAESRFTHIACGIRNFRPRHQRPRGGP